MAKDYVRVFTTKDKNDKTVTLKVVKPSQKVVMDADFEYRKIWSQAIKNGVMTEGQLRKYVKKDDLWTNDDEKRESELQEKLDRFVEKLTDDLSLDDGRAVVEKIKEIREELREHQSTLNSMFNNTAEAMANENRNQYYAVHCTLHNVTEERFFSDIGDFRDSLDAECAIDAYREVLLMNIEMSTGMKLNSDLDADLPENMWLLEKEKEELPGEIKSEKKVRRKSQKSKKSE